LSGGQVTRDDVLREANRLPPALRDQFDRGPAGRAELARSIADKRLLVQDIARRQSEHGGRFVLERIDQSPVTRGEARSIEQALINRNASFENIRNSISPNHSWYREADEWGEAWLKSAGYLP